MSKEKYIKAQVTVECFFKTDKLQNIEEIKSYVQSVLNNHLNEEWQTMRTMPNWDSFKITEYKEMYAKGGGVDMDNYAYAKTRGIENIDWEKEMKEYYGANWDKLTKDEKESAIEFAKREEIRSKSFAKGGGVSDRIYLPKGYTFVVVGSHRSKQQLNRYAVEYISLYKIGGSQGTSGTYTLLMSNNDYEKIKNIRGVTKKEYLKSDVHWFSRKESDKINKVFQKIEQKYSGGGGVDDDLEYKRRIKKFGFKPYGKTKGRFTVYFIDEGKEQKEIWETKEMAINTAKRYSKLFNSVKVKDENGNEIEYSKGGKTTFKEKVASIKSKLLKNKKVPKAVQKDYGKTFSPAEAEDSAKRIAGAMRKKELINKK